MMMHMIDFSILSITAIVGAVLWCCGVNDNDKTITITTSRQRHEAMVTWSEAGLT